MEQVLSLVEKARSFHSHKTLATDVEKEETSENTGLQSIGCSVQRLWKDRGHFEKVCLKAKCSTHSLEVPQASTSSAGAGEPLYFDDDGQPIFTHMVSVPHATQTFDQVSHSIGLYDRNRMEQGGRNKIENSTDSTVPPQTVLLKAGHRGQC